MIKISDILDYLIYIKIDPDTGKPTDKPQSLYFVDNKQYLTLRSAYPRLKSELEPPKENSQKTQNTGFHEPLKGGRPQLFTEQQKNEIFHKHTHFNVSKNALAKQYHCSEGTIRNIIKNMY